jgi:hypothetical protein
MLTRFTHIAQALTRCTAVLRNKSRARFIQPPALCGGITPTLKGAFT